MNSVLATRSTPPPAAVAPLGGGSGAPAVVDGTAGAIRGAFTTFGTWACIGGAFMEMIAPDAFTASIARDRASIRCVFQHGREAAQGLKPLGRILTLRGTGEYEVEPLVGAGYVDELLPALRAGLLGSSMSFVPVPEEVTVSHRPGKSASNPEGLPEIVIRRARLIEFGPVTFPAYAGATALVEGRSGQ